MQARHLSAISEFTTDVRHLEGKANVVADALSRVEIDSAAPSLGIDFRELAKAQRQDPETRAARTAISGLRLQDVDMGGAMLLCDVSQGRPRPWVPDPFRRTVFQAFHNLSHPGARATGRLVAERFVWHGLKRDTTKWARECLACQRSKIHRHVRSALEKVPVPDARFQSVNIDLVGPLPPSQGFAYLLMIVDRFSQWPEAIPIPRHGRVYGGKSVLGPMGVPFRHPGGNYFGQRGSVHLSVVVRHGSVAGNLAAPDNGGQRNGGEVSPTVEGLTRSTAYGSQLDGSATMGHVGD